MKNKELMKVIFDIDLPVNCVCDSDMIDQECIKNGKCLFCKKWQDNENYMLTSKLEKICYDPKFEHLGRYTYYFYNHFAMGEDKQAVYDAIENHDFAAFTKIRKKYLTKKYNPEGWTYLPNEVFDDVAGGYVPLTEERFHQISHYESECG